MDQAEANICGFQPKNKKKYIDDLYNHDDNYYVFRKFAKWNYRLISVRWIIEWDDIIRWSKRFNVVMQAEISIEIWLYYIFSTSIICLIWICGTERLYRNHLVEAILIDNAILLRNRTNVLQPYKWFETLQMLCKMFLFKKEKIAKNQVSCMVKS